MEKPVNPNQPTTQSAPAIQSESVTLVPTKSEQRSQMPSDVTPSEIAPNIAHPRKEKLKPGKFQSFATFEDKPKTNKSED